MGIRAGWRLLVTVPSVMDNTCKQSGSFRTHLLRAALVLSLALSVQLLPALPAHAATPPPESPGCETYGCLYEHCPTHYARGGSAECQYGVAHEQLPDGPDGRRFVGVLWPEGYDPSRRAMWDQVAYCESTWRWHYSGSSGFHGGVQFTASTWRAFGGEQFAGFAFQATPEQQIAVAERVAYYGWTRPDGSRVAPQGPRAWPHCGGVLRPPA
ncbi:hypothetical protein BH23ACT9_BH23ACT9_09500 [soil metagenome]